MEFKNYDIYLGLSLDGNMGTTSSYKIESTVRGQLYTYSQSSAKPKAFINIVPINSL